MASSDRHTGTMWRLLEQVAELERRSAALYERFAELFQPSPPVALFWREMAGEERLHALILAAAREVFPATEPAVPGDWNERLHELEALLTRLESRAMTGLRLEAAFACAEELEASELNTLTALLVNRAGTGFSCLAPLVRQTGVDRHRDRVVEARYRFGRGNAARGS